MAPKPRPKIFEDSERTPGMDQKPRPKSSSSAPRCLHEAKAAAKPRRRPIPTKPLPTQEEIAAQIAARIAQLQGPNADATPKVKVKSIIELQSTKVARLTTRIAKSEAEIKEKTERIKRNEAEIARLEALKARDDAVAKNGNGAGAKTGTTDLEKLKQSALALLTRFHAGELSDKGATDAIRELLVRALDDSNGVDGLAEIVGELDLENEELWGKRTKAAGKNDGNGETKEEKKKSEDFL